MYLQLRDNSHITSAVTPPPSGADSAPEGRGFLNADATVISILHIALCKLDELGGGVLLLLSNQNR